MPSARGTLDWSAAADHPELVAEPVAKALASAPSAEVAVIDPTLADTESFCEAYDVAMEASANCVIVAGRRGQVTTMAAVMVLASDRADINKTVRHHLDVRKISFAHRDEAVALSGMEFGGITPIGLPGDWPVLIDAGVAAAAAVVIGSGLRSSKLLVDPADLVGLAGAEVLDLALPSS